MPRLTAIRKQALDDIMKEAIFQAAVAVLSEHGVEGMTMDRVATAAELAKGSLYKYFSSKRSLLEFIYARMIDPLFESLEQTVASPFSANEKLATHVKHLLEHVGRNAKVYKLLFEDDTAHGLLQSSERRTLDLAGRQLAEVFRQGIDEGVFRPADPLVLARMFMGLCVGLFRGQPDLATPEPREDAERLILNVFLNGAATEKGPLHL